MILQGFLSILSGAKHYNKKRSNEVSTKGLTEYLIEKNEANHYSNEKNVKGGYLKILILYTTPVAAWHACLLLEQSSGKAQWNVLHSNQTKRILKALWIFQYNQNVL